MKSRVFLILFSSFLVNISIGQEISKSDIIKFKIKSIEKIDSEGNIEFINFYNNKGDLIKSSSLNDNKSLQTDRELFYNDSSQLIEERKYTSIGDTNTISKYYYNSKNQLIKKEYISLGEVSATLIFDYDDKGNTISAKQTSELMGNNLTKYRYDNENFLIEEDKSNNTIGKEERINYKYNDNKQIIEKKTKVYYFNTTITSTYTYNDAGKLSKIFEKSSNGVSSTKIYQYNDKGILINELWESSISKTPHKTTYQINFD
ncbi:hypothetical protein [Emticicia agri]|uniref:YD repeat-containing protein n=1 Tax=Emticicia agri TaxID=2492393 RepID=A0A4V1ZD53_9BACT|nr:hypothetical protein [Emticicia agri]RYU94960.1 hypothetical protein EWM59_14810 [Emticicia agri]